MMVSLAVQCSTLFVVTIYFSGVEPHADSRIENTEKKHDEGQQDISVYFRPMLGKRAGNTLSPLLETSGPFVTGVQSHETETPWYQPDDDHSLVLRWYTPRLGKRATYYTPRLGKRMSYYTPRLGRCDIEDNDLHHSLWDARDTLDENLPMERRGEGKEEKMWKVVGMFNPRLGRSLPSDIADLYQAREQFKNTVSLSSD